MVPSHDIGAALKTPQSGMRMMDLDDLMKLPLIKSQ